MREGGGVQDGVKGGKWDNCNSIINKIYLKNKIKYLKRKKKEQFRRQGEGQEYQPHSCDFLMTDGASHGPELREAVRAAFTD